MLAAIGVVLMAFIEVPYPPVPFLKIEFSDIVILIAFALFGFKGAFCVAVVKTLGDLLLQQPTGPYAIGQITALCASMSYVFLLKATKLNIKEDGLKKIIIKSIIIVLSVTCIMTIANYIFITPIFSGQFLWFQMTNGAVLGYEGSYIASILLTYIPFNLIKGTLTLTIFGLIGSRVISIYQNSNE